MVKDFRVKRRFDKSFKQWTNVSDALFVLGNCESSMRRFHLGDVLGGQEKTPLSDHQLDPV